MRAEKAARRGVGRAAQFQDFSQQSLSLSNQKTM
jgi:hypothetical protein